MKVKSNLTISQTMTGFIINDDTGEESRRQTMWFVETLDQLNTVISNHFKQED